MFFAGTWQCSVIFFGITCGLEFGDHGSFGLIWFWSTRSLRHSGLSVCSVPWVVVLHLHCPFLGLQASMSCLGTYLYFLSFCWDWEYPLSNHSPGIFQGIWHPFWMPFSILIALGVLPYWKPNHSGLFNAVWVYKSSAEHQRALWNLVYDLISFSS